MTIGGNFKDDDWHGALMNINISDGQIAEWEIKIDSTDHLSYIGLGMTNTSSPSKWNLSAPHFIGVYGENGNKFIKGSGELYASKLHENDVVRFKLDMIKGELSLYINNIDKGILASDFEEKQWWPYCAFFNYGGSNGYACSLKSFQFISSDE
eukprot:TRINITY_DN216_c1_g1_i1.p1 TRINITY_DN216_c1_g1~~TRINITY_DN216_c1_g1_i1.p1  ORF type:complete len:162 (+),score=50.56 TRINITY_DN216_c1_g1_i1:28-486(+)